MRQSKGNSIIEVIVAIVIISSGVLGAYQVLNSGSKLSESTKTRIQAINISREGLEIVQNIRETNWLRFSGDIPNCWFARGYDSNCVASTGTYEMTGSSYSYVPIQQGSGAWILEGRGASGTYATTYTGAYATGFALWFTSDGFTSQTGTTGTGCTQLRQTDCLSRFTREVQLEYSGSTLPHKIVIVKSIVRWMDSNSSRLNEISLQTSLTNWMEDLK